MYYVSWKDAVSFCERLNARQRAAGRLPSDYEYALPTEAQWEYADRAGTATASYAGNLTAQDQRIAILDEIAWYDANSAVGYTGRGWLINGQRAGRHAVAQRRPNDWGLYDMTGNLWEWAANGTAPTLAARPSIRSDPHLARRASIAAAASAVARVTCAPPPVPPAEASVFRGIRLAFTPCASVTGLLRLAPDADVL